MSTTSVVCSECGERCYDAAPCSCCVRTDNTRDAADARLEAQERRIRELERREPTSEEMEAALAGKDEAFLGGTVRRCRGCKAPVFGGPNACVRCASLDEGLREAQAVMDALFGRSSSEDDLLIEAQDQIESLKRLENEREAGA
jgi:hypothetical protein